jgi:hypothetical protein
VEGREQGFDVSEERLVRDDEWQMKRAAEKLVEDPMDGYMLLLMEILLFAATITILKRYLEISMTSQLVIFG